MLTRGGLLICLALFATLPLNDAKFNYKKFNKLFDSSEESVHGSSEERDREVKASKVSHNEYHNTSV